MNESKPSLAGSGPSSTARSKGDGVGSRRHFLLRLAASPFAIGWVAFSGAVLAMLAGTLRFFFPNVLSEPASRVRVGSPKNIDEGTVSEAFKERGFVLVRQHDRIVALNTTCTHLGCTINWMDTDQKFKCPCHGSGFDRNGVNFEGPAPRPLERFAIFEEQGQLIVDKNRKFQKELGQWEQADSYYKV